MKPYRIEWPDATHPRSIHAGSAYPLTRGVVSVCGSHLDRAAQKQLRDWLTWRLEKTA